jgi:hypothetical protein
MSTRIASKRRVVQHGADGIAEAEAADHHVQSAAVETRQRQVRKRDLAAGEQAGHQERIAQLDLVDLGAEGRHGAAAQAQLAERRVALGEFFEVDGHAVTWVVMERRRRSSTPRPPSPTGDRLT